MQGEQQQKDIDRRYYLLEVGNKMNIYRKYFHIRIL